MGKESEKEIQMEIKCNVCNSLLRLWKETASGVALVGEPPVPIKNYEDKKVVIIRDFMKVHKKCKEKKKEI